MTTIGPTGSVGSGTQIDTKILQTFTPNYMGDLIMQNMVAQYFGEILKGGFNFNSVNIIKIICLI